MALDEYLRGEDERQLLQKKMKQDGRLPPGQAATIKWPVLHTGDVPVFDPRTWDFRVDGLVDAPLDLGWDAFQALPRSQGTRSRETTSTPIQLVLDWTAGLKR